MTEVAFHTGVPDKLAYTCRLLRKAWRQGARVAVTADAAELARLDLMLWVFEQDEFVPHVRCRSAAAVPADQCRTPIWLIDPGADPGNGLAQATVLVNLGLDAQDGQDQYQRVIEVVSTSEAELQSGRQRWRAYLAKGVTPVNIAIGQEAGADPS